MAGRKEYSRKRLRLVRQVNLLVIVNWTAGSVSRVKLRYADKLSIRFAPSYNSFAPGCK